MPACYLSMSLANAERFKKFITAQEVKGCQVTLKGVETTPKLKSDVKVGFRFNHDSSPSVVFQMYWNNDGSEVNFAILKMTEIYPLMRSGDVTLHTTESDRTKNTHVHVGDWLTLSWCKEKENTFSDLFILRGQKMYEMYDEVNKEAQLEWSRRIKSSLGVEVSPHLIKINLKSCTFGVILSNNKVLVIEGTLICGGWNFLSNGLPVQMAAYMALNDLKL